MKQFWVNFVILCAVFTNRKQRYGNNLKLSYLLFFVMALEIKQLEVSDYSGKA